MEKKFIMPTNITMPGSKSQWKNFFVDKKNEKAIHTRFKIFNAKQSLKNGEISEDQFRMIMKSISLGK